MWTDKIIDIEQDRSPEPLASSVHPLISSLGSFSPSPLSVSLTTHNYTSLRKNTPRRHGHISSIWIGSFYFWPSGLTSDRSAVIHRSSPVTDDRPVRSYRRVILHRAFAVGLG